MEMAYSRLFVQWRRGGRTARRPRRIKTQMHPRNQILRKHDEFCCDFSSCPQVEGCEMGLPVVQHHCTCQSTQQFSMSADKVWCGLTVSHSCCWQYVSLCTAWWLCCNNGCSRTTQYHTFEAFALSGVFAATECKQTFEMSWHCTMCAPICEWTLGYFEVCTFAHVGFRARYKP